MALEHWRLLAECAELDPNWFHPERGESGSLDDDELDPEEAKTVELALAACQRCPVRYVCLQENLGQPLGIWGGWQRGTRETIRRLGLGCPACGVKIRAKSKQPRVFCSDECTLAASYASGESAELIDKELDWQVERGYLFNLKRREALNAA